MKLSEALLEIYAKKILGFAYLKTGNSFEAEDLAQEIMLQLITCIDKQNDIEHLDSFVYTVSCYTWSKYLRSNKKHWNYAGLDEADEVASEADIELEAENKVMYARLRKAVSTLAKTQREIIIMHYYEGKTTAEISGILGINDSTVRWYLGNIRKDLKEKINMSENNLDVRPVSLCVGIDGWIEDEHAREFLMEDLLVQNIAIACYGEPLTISEISEKLNVASAYLERHIENMVYMDFLKETGRKYQTNFFIKTDKVQEKEVIYGYENAKPYADRIYEAVMKKKADIESIDYFNKTDVNIDCLLWHILLNTAQGLAYEAMADSWKKHNITDRPLRKDGSKYWVIANVRYNELKGLNDSQREYADYRQCCGFKENMSDFAELYQADTFFLSLCGLCCRDSSTDNIMKLAHVVKSIMEKSGREKALMSDATEYEKTLISEFVKDGYISIKDERLVINIPVLTKEQLKQLEDIICDIKISLGNDFMKEYIMGFGKAMEPLIPEFLDKNIRNYHKYAVMGGFDMFAYMIKEAKEKTIKLTLPDEEAAKYALTMLVFKS